MQTQVENLYIVATPLGYFITVRKASCSSEFIILFFCTKNINFFLKIINISTYFKDFSKATTRLPFLFCSFFLICFCFCFFFFVNFFYKITNLTTGSSYREKGKNISYVYIFNSLHEFSQFMSNLQVVIKSKESFK